MEEFIVKGGKKLRLGCTTGSCAAAAAKAAACLLLTGRPMEQATLVTPKGVRIALPVQTLQTAAGSVTCAVEKDQSDDPDVTRGALITATVSRTGGSGVTHRHAIFQQL